ncbi:MAG: hypothetical protein FWG96_01320 [Methanomassiliicoccaceae archaeon]|nr:hypothetical protein [Methanomassiliicoccaceae archaeon]
MDFGDTAFRLGIIIVLVVVIAMVVLLQGYMGAKYNLQDKITGKSRKKSTIFLDETESDKKCEICYGKIDEDPIAKCSCGRVFHDACARPTGSCPYCGASYEKMEVREPERFRCPRCGKFLKGNICSCGAVIPRKDETFVCRCGNTVDVNKPVCKKCGAVYEMAFMPVLREKEDEE